MRLKRTSQWLSSLLAVSVGASLLIPTVNAAGVGRRTIKIGIHTPLTGAAPVPSDTAQQGADIYWRWRRSKEKPINGRHVDVVLNNDNSNPSQAVAVCKEMVEKDEVFLLSGLMNPDGKDQTQACARYAASVDVPYVALGQMQRGVKRLPNYFAFSMTWPAQSRLLAEFLVERLAAKRRSNGMVRHDSPNYQDSHAAFVDAMDGKRATVDYDRAVNKNASSSEAQAIIQELKLAGVENVFVLVRSTFFLQLLKAADSQDYHPRWTGIGITATASDEIAKIGCEGNQAISGARFFSPLPAFVNRDRFDPNYSRAMREIYESQGDNISWLGWATSRHLAKLLERAGRKLTRGRFANRTERARRVKTGIMPPLRFSPRDHFGGRAIYVLKPDCSAQRWVTAGKAKSRF
ncbi:MAG TPA: ABC transporter substrate-binding protein [Actinomycetota bacterium]|nr:ABC transporter substrate-binding protein [Actinomycetota bacterium]